MAADGTGTGWDDSSPSNSAKVSSGPIEIRDLRKGVEIRVGVEHVTPAASSVGGQHLGGSAIAFDQIAAPVSKPYQTGTVLANQIPLDMTDKGRLWFDGNRLWRWNGASWDVATGYMRKAYMQQSTPSGGNAGTLTANTWTRRPLNVLQALDDGFLALDTTTGIITMQPGTYRVEAWAVGYRVDGHQIRFRQTSGTASTRLVGTVAVAPNSAQVTSLSYLSGPLNVTVANTTYEVQHYASTTEATNGMGPGLTTGESVLSCMCVIEKLGR